MKLSCSQVNSLLNFYISNKLNNQIREIVEEHIEKCSVCREKYQTLLSIKLQFIQAKEYLDNIGTKTSSEQVLSDEKIQTPIQILSEYSDNELSDEESLKVKKCIMKNLSTRKSLEELYELRNSIKQSFEKSEALMKEDYSKNVLNRIELENEFKRGGSKLKVASVLIFLLTSFTVGLIYLITNLLV